MNFFKKKVKYKNNEIKAGFSCSNKMEPNAQLSDEEIVFRVQNGDVDLFSVVIFRYKEKISRYARKFLSETEDINDIVQDIFIKIYINVKAFDPKRKFSSWLYRIAHNELVNHLKKHSKRKVLPLFDFDTILPVKHGTDYLEEAVREEFKEKINKFLDKLEPKYKEPIILYYLQELSYQEIADIMEIPVSTVGVRISRAKSIMKSLLKNYG